MKRITARLWLVGIAATLLVSAPGCLPGAAWLPDSSGFYYAAGAKFDKLMFFDVAKKMPRQVVAKLPGSTITPAVSPDGKEVAVAELVPQVQAASKLTIAFYDPAGNLLRKSPTVSFGAVPRGGPKEDKAVLHLYWSPTAGKLLVCGVNDTGIYDVAGGQLLSLSNTIVCSFGGTPFRPDGEGFFAVWERKPDSNKLEYAFVNWKGTRKPINGAPVIGLTQKLGDELLEMLVIPGNHQSRWEGNTAIVQVNTALLRLDGVKLQGKLETISPVLAEDGKPVHRSFTFAKTKHEVRIVQVGPRPGAKDNSAPKGERRPVFRVEVLKAGQSKAEAIEGNVEDCVLVPSPNRELLIVRCLLAMPADQPMTERLLVFTQDGTAIGDFNPVK